MIRTPRARRRPATTDTSPPAPVVLHPDAVFTLPQLQAALGLTRSTLAREHRLGRLRVARAGKRHFILGSWARAWIEAGELRPKGRKGVASCSSD